MILLWHLIFANEILQHCTFFLFFFFAYIRLRPPTGLFSFSLQLVKRWLISGYRAFYIYTYWLRIPKVCRSKNKVFYLFIYLFIYFRKNGGLLNRVLNIFNNDYYSSLLPLPSSK